MSYLNFTKLLTPPRRRTSVWRVESLDGMHLGGVSWFPGWRRYVFRPVEACLFDGDCLREVAAFCERQMREREAQREGA